MSYLACVFHYRSDNTYINSKQVTLTDTSTFQLKNKKDTLPGLTNNCIDMGIPTLRLSVLYDQPILRTVITDMDVCTEDSCGDHATCKEGIGLLFTCPCDEGFVMDEDSGECVGE